MQLFTPLPYCTHLVIYIGSLYYFSSISMLSEWKTMEESARNVILMAGPSLENWGLKPSRAIFRHKIDFFGQKISQHRWDIVTLLYTSIPFQRCKNRINQSSYAKVMPPAS
jgi:hypothetical protein